MIVPLTRHTLALRSEKMPMRFLLLTDKLCIETIYWMRLIFILFQRIKKNINGKSAFSADELDIFETTVTM